MTYEKIVQQIIDAGNNPNDFTITILVNGYKVEPRASYEPRQIAKEEDEQVRLEMARGNAELFETMLMMNGGGM
ncbi:hypothetical protein V7122_02590 [Bacillus sp. JJ1532]|uniref:hypothetical protein n=1 Tax=Bacillus sp. JJ1532 TaxID=3122958 RepID=UPI002FFE22CF